ncbi:MAG: DNA polymerase III subunit gamma/tau [Acutalibacteraceae bacterium]|nr:DNA polymerase III subunit gamma/tau [Acutalibacteraceae bacterium]
MAYQALYRKYRPTAFSEVVGQEHITETLKNQLSSGKIFHAYLFTGTRGTGKTSCAKILSKAVNCLSSVNGDPCGECAACKAIAQGENTDIAEIDAASNNGVDDIRSLREQVNFAPANSKYRIYIIDEVHMLTDNAFNALLKTLEEPPAHIIFILATTEVHKLPATILSRCQRFDFRRIDSSVIASRLKFVAQQEGLTITDGAATLIASAADGGMRDALSLLDLCVSSGKVIDEETVSVACGMAGQDYLCNLSEAVKNKDCSAALSLLDEIHNSSVDMLRLLNELTRHYRDLMIVKTVKGDKKPIVCSPDHMNSLINQAESYPLKDIMWSLKVLQEAFAQMQTGNRRLQMEMTLIRLCGKDDSSTTSADLLRRIITLEEALSTGNVTAVPKKAEERCENITVEKEETESEQNETVKTSDGPLDCWEEILEQVFLLCPPAIGILNGSKAYIQGDFLLIDAPNPMFRSMMNSSDTMRNSIRQAAEKRLGRAFRLGPYKNQSKKGSGVDPLMIVANKLNDIKNNGGNQ